MRRNDLIIVTFSLAALASWQRDVPAQQPQSRCSQVSYSAPDVGLQHYRLTRVEGQAVYASPTAQWESGAVVGACVTLFGVKGKEPVATVTTDDKGQFKFVNIAPGEYTLRAFAGGLQKVSIPIQIIPAGGATRSRRLLLHLREELDGRKSYVTPVTNPALRKKLLALVEKDQNIRNEIIKRGADHPDKEVLARMAVIDRQNTSWMKSIIKRYGWPGPGLVGWDGTEAAFLLVQHSDHLTQKELLPLMQKEYRAGTLRGPNYALFIDRVLVEDGKPQLYGLRARPSDQWKGGEPVLYPIEDEANVDRRRAEVGLPPLAEYLEFIKHMYHPRSN